MRCVIGKQKPTIIHQCVCSGEWVNKMKVIDRSKKEAEEEHTKLDVPVGHDYERRTRIACLGCSLLVGTHMWLSRGCVEHKLHACIRHRRGRRKSGWREGRSPKRDGATSREARDEQLGTTVFSRLNLYYATCKKLYERTQLRGVDRVDCPCLPSVLKPWRWRYGMLPVMQHIECSSIVATWLE